MISHLSKTLGIWIFAFSVSDAMAQEISLLGPDSDGEEYFRTAQGMSPDGRFVVGSLIDPSLSPAGNRLPALFANQSLTSLGNIGFGFGAAADVSDNGEVIVGNSDLQPSTRRAFVWTADQGVVDIGTLSNGPLDEAIADAVSGDGEIVVGRSLLANDNSSRRAFSWTQEAGMVSLGSLYGFEGYSFARDISRDGRVIVGASGTTTAGISGDVNAVRWVSGEIRDLGSLTEEGTANAVAYSVSDDGSVIVGESSVTSGVRRAFRWTNETMNDLGTLDQSGVGNSRAFGVSGDGQIVVGDSGNGEGQTVAFRWTSGAGMVSLGTLQDGDVGNSMATATNTDGSVVIGRSDFDGDMRAFIWRADTMLDHVNTGIAVQQSAQALAAAAAHYGQSTVYQLGREVALRGPGGGDGARVSTRGEAAAQMPVAVRVGGRLVHTDDVATSGRAEVTAAVGLTPTLTLGGFVEITGESDSHSVVSLDGTHVAGGASLRYRAAPDGTGLTWRVAAVRGGGDFDVTRQDILPNTERGEGATSLTTTGLSAEIGYGYAVPRGVVTPFARLTGSRVERDGFAETDAIAFPLSYDAHEDEALTVTLGADARLDVSAQVTLELGVGISHDLDRDTDPVTGTSAIPGFTNFSVDGPDLENRTRGHVSAGYSHALGAGRAISGSLSLSQSPWADDVSVGARVGYEMRF